MQEIFLARQPIVDRNDNMVAFELLFRSANKTEAGVIDDTHAWRMVMSIIYSVGTSELRNASIDTC